MLDLRLPRRFNAAEYFIDRQSRRPGAKTAILSEKRAVYLPRTARERQPHGQRARRTRRRMEERVMLLLKDTRNRLRFYAR